MTAREKLDARATELKLDGTGLSNTKLAKLIKDTEAANASPADQSTGNQPVAETISGAALKSDAQAAADTQAAADAQAAASEEGPTITVVGPKKGRWRIGRQFTLEPTVIAVSDLTEDQIAALERDPLLIINAAASR